MGPNVVSSGGRTRGRPGGMTLCTGWKVTEAFSVAPTVIGQKLIADVVTGGILIVVVMVAAVPPEFDRSVVVRGGQKMVVGVARGKGGRTIVQGAVHWMPGVGPCQIDSGG